MSTQDKRDEAHLAIEIEPELRKRIEPEDFSLCAEVAANEPAFAHGHHVADLTSSRLRLASNQRVAGYCLLGNAVPHLQCHITPRYYGDPAPNRPLDPNLGTRLLTEEERVAQIAQLRSALAGDGTMR